MSNAAVIGATGFLGSWLTDGLTTAGIPVAGFTRRSPALTGDVLAPELRSAAVIFYLATSVTPGSAERSPGLARADVTEFRRFLAALDRLGTRPAVVLASTADCYDAAIDPPYPEDAPLRPEKVYSQGKLAMERLLRAARGVRPLVIRMASMYGPGHRTDPGHGVIAHWLTAAARGRPLHQLGDDETVRDFVFVADAADALVRVHRRLGLGDALPFALNIGSGEPVSLGGLRRELVAVTGHASGVRRSPARAFDRGALVLDVELAAKALGWRPATSLHAGLQQTWLAVQEHESAQSPTARAEPR